MTTPRPKVIIGTCSKCGRLWLTHSTGPAKCARCGADLVFSQPTETPPEKPARKDPPQKKPAKKLAQKKKEPRPEPVEKPRRVSSQAIELPRWIQPLPLSDYQVLMLGSECAAHVLNGFPPHEDFIPGQIITLIHRLWGMALWLEAGQAGGDL